MNLSYEILFKDEETYSAKSLDGMWTIPPQKPIKSLKYFFNDKFLVMEGYEAYNHLIEKISIQGSRNMVTQIILMGRNHDSTDLIMFDFKRKKILKETVDIGYEYGKQILNGWREGVVGERGRVDVEPVH